MIKFVAQLILELAFACLLFFNVFVSKSFDTTICLAGLVVFTGLSYFIKNHRKPIVRNKSDAMLVVGGLTITLLGILYIIGYKSGFSYNYSSIFKNYIKVKTYIIVPLIVVLTEFARYLLVNIQSDKKTYNYIIQGLLLVIFFLIEMNISKKVYDLRSFNQLYEMFALIFVQSISKNLLLNYMVKRYSVGPCLLYRFIMDMYIYIIPITPKVNTFIEGIILLIFPYIVFSVLKLIDNRVLKEEKKRLKKKRIVRGWRKVADYVVGTITTIVFVILVILVSREFKYAMIAIGSESMTGTFNKGDAVIYEKIDATKEKLNENDVIVFEKEGVTIVHRIYKVYRIAGNTVYKTKGDHNDLPDNWVVEAKAIKGVVKQSVPLIAWPSVLLNEMF